MTDIRKAAAAEASAEQTREKAEARWRKAWWATTVALAEPTAAADVKAANRIVQEELGQNISYLGKRRAAGKAFSSLKGRVADLPPRLAIAWVEAHRGEQADESVADELRQAEADGVSLREFADRYGQRFEPPAPSPDEALAQASPAAIARRAAEPDVARAIARNDAAREAVEDQAIEHRATTRIEQPVIDPARSGRTVERSISRRLDEDPVVEYLRDAHEYAAEALAHFNDAGTTDEEGVRFQAARIRRVLDAIEGHDEVLTDEDREFLNKIGVK